MGLEAERRAELSRKGAVETTVGDFFGIDEAGMQVVELRVRIAKEVRRRRLAARMTQKSLAGRMSVSEPRIADIEAGTSTSLDTVVLAFFASGGDLAELASVVTGDGPLAGTAEPSLAVHSREQRAGRQIGRD